MGTWVGNFNVCSCEENVCDVTEYISISITCANKMLLEFVSIFLKANAIISDETIKFIINQNYFNFGNFSKPILYRYIKDLS